MTNLRSFQFDQSQLMLASAEYYQLGLSHPIMQTYYNILVSVAKMMGADDKIAKKDMKDLLEFEIELAKVPIIFDFYSNRQIRKNI